MARTANTEVATVETVEAVESPVVRTKRVIIQRPAGNTDSHIFLGFNSFEGPVLHKAGHRKAKS